MAPNDKDEFVNVIEVIGPLKARLEKDVECGDGTCRGARAERNVEVDSCLISVLLSELVGDM